MIRLAVLTMEGLASAVPVRRFVADHADRITFVGLSDPYRPQQGGMTGQAIRHLKRSGVRFLPYLLANFSLPRLARWLPVKRDRPDAIPLERLCESLGIQSGTVSDMNRSDFHARLKASGAELLLTFHCDQILTAETISCLPRGALNVHAGLLPEHRGPVPTIHALLQDQPSFGVAIHRMIPRIDAGPILAQKRLALPSTTSAIQAAKLLHSEAVPMLISVLDAIETDSIVETPPSLLPYCGFPTPAQLRRLAAMGRRTASWRDLLDALQTPI